MTKKPEEIYKEFVATGRYSEAELKEIRKNLNKPPKQIDRAKAEKADAAYWSLVDVAEKEELISVRRLDDNADDYNYIIQLDFKGSFAILEGANKRAVVKAMNDADNTVISGNGNSVRILLGFMYVWDSKENIDKQIEMSAN